MRTVELTCIICPASCNLVVALDDRGEVINVSGWMCRRGVEYAIQEIKSPKRVVISVVPVIGGDMPTVSVKTDRPVDKACVEEVMRALANVVVKAPVRVGQVILEDVCGARIVATREVKEAVPRGGVSALSRH